MSGTFTRTVALLLSLQIASAGTPWAAASAFTPCGNQPRSAIAPILSVEEQALNPALASAQFRLQNFHVLAAVAVIVVIHALLTPHGVAALAHHGSTLLFAAIPISGGTFEEEDYPFSMNKLENGRTEFRFKLPQRILNYLRNRPMIEGATPSVIMTRIIQNEWLGRADGPQTIKRRVDHYDAAKEEVWKNSGFTIVDRVVDPFVASLKKNGWLQHLPNIFIALVDHARSVAEMKRESAITHIRTLADEIKPSLAVEPLNRAETYAIAIIDNTSWREVLQALSDYEVRALQKILVDNPSNEQLARSLTTRTREVTPIGARQVVRSIANKLHPDLFTGRFLRNGPKPAAAAAPDRFIKSVEASS